ncbi:MAG: VanZ family protein [Akkermansiaceae bacterium]|jgi:VanZ family protein|nr:VanZ family protein [Akkermansiaceae bacterium]MDP4646802.1 VanZ family protein [Akkermansiaceae bacterium]MDP4719998.1 VanZ family protein [Akkermansiaceae bacterium]MDP4779718.1 VanZ family protein [Akkermansiaceae bacterium]MDP4846621.1 VanZ family protein [Akkermansiaceae bacterium]
MRLTTSPRLWLTAFFFWAATLYILSSFSKTMPEGGPEIPHIDKVLHFGYFLGGGIMLATHILLKKGTTAPFFVRIIIPIALLAIIGALDEYHQTFTPGRSGNDPFDWLADVLGAATGVALAHALHPRLLKFSSKNPHFT